MTLQDRIETWSQAMAAALSAYAEAQAADARAQVALDDTRTTTERRIRDATKDAKKKPTEAAIMLAVADDADVITDTHAALDARIALKSAESTVETQKALGRALSWHVQLTCHAETTPAA